MTAVNLSRRLAALEGRRSRANRRVAIVLATDEADRDRQVAAMLPSGVLGASDGLLCITGRPAPVAVFQ